MRLILLIALFSLGTYTSQAQKLTGTVYTANGDLLPYCTIKVVENKKNATANAKGKYALNITKGTYTVTCEHVGYKKQAKKITIDQDDVEMSFVMQTQTLEMDAVVVKTGGEDPAYRIIRAAIKARSKHLSEITSFSCDLYTKDIIRLTSLPKKIFGQKIEENDKAESGLDSSGRGVVYLSESIATVYTQQPDKFKMEVKSSRVSGSNSFGFSFPTFISFYNNNITVFSEKLNPRGFVSPISEGALGFYKYKYLGTFFEDGKEIHTIQIKAKRAFEPLFNGTINIIEGSWYIHSLDVTLTKKSQLEILDTLRITQLHSLITEDKWRTNNQQLQFSLKVFGVGLNGGFLNVYSNYNIKPQYPKKFFDKIAIAYDTAVNKRPLAYWDSIRPVALEPDEVKDYEKKDSMFNASLTRDTSKMYRDSLNAKRQKIKLKELFIGGGIGKSKFTKTGSRSWRIEPLLKNLEYNPAEGLVSNLRLSFRKYNRKKNLSLEFAPTVRYGFSNTHLNAFADINIRKRGQNKLGERFAQWQISGGSRVSEFNSSNSIPPLVSSISTLLYGRNFYKIYENVFASAQWSKSFQSGLKMEAKFLFEDRKPLDNTTDFTLIKKYKTNIEPNYPIEQLISNFTPHQSAQVSFKMSFQPGQRYIQFPRYKVPLGSKYPTFTAEYTKGFKQIFGSDVNFDKYRFTINDDMNFKLLGKFRYKVGVGGFINNNSVPIQDYQHFNGNVTFWASEYLNSYQLAKLYAYSTTQGFYATGHGEHHFNGLLTNKIPLFRRLNWNLVAAANAFYVNKNNNYAEFSVGLENIFKLFRLDVVTAVQSGRSIQSGLKIGFGGLLGSSISTGKDDNGDSFLSLSF